MEEKPVTVDDMVDVGTAATIVGLALCEAAVRKGLLSWAEVEDAIGAIALDSMHSKLGPKGHAIIDHALSVVRKRRLGLVSDGPRGSPRGDH
jgi:hypothetical protein